MTIDEAIKDIKDNIKPVVGGKSLDMAIDALEQAKPNCSEIPNNSDTISRQEAIDELNDEYHGTISDESMKIYQIIKWLNELPSVQPEQRWIPVTEIPPRGRDLMLKIYDKHNLFYYYHMGFHDGKKYYTYNFFWWEDKDLEIVGWQLCPWEEGKQDG